MIRRSGAVLVLGAVAWALLAGASSAAEYTDPVFDAQADAQRLVNLLADATAAQQVCYGWSVRVFDVAGTTQQSTGSNFGLGRSLGETTGLCRYQVEFTANITYTSPTAEAEDDATWSVISTPNGPDTTDLNRLELFDEADLVGDNPDAAVAQAVAVLPQLAVGAGIAPPLTATPASSTPPDAGSLADDPGSDYLRRAGGLLLFGTVLFIGGLAVGAYALRNARSRGQPARPPGPPAGPPPSLGPLPPGPSPPLGPSPPQH